MKDEMWRVKYLKIIEVLKQETDEDKPIKTSDLLKSLEGRGVKVCRNVIYKDINILQKHGYDIKCISKKQNEYYLAKRELNIPELRIIMDVIEASTFISDEMTANLLEKVANISGSYRGNLLLRNNNYYDTNKHSNKEVFNSIDNIEEAINGKNKIEFNYFDINHKLEIVPRKDDETNEDKKYILNPIATLYTNDNYYLIGYSDKYNSIRNYRIDRMINVKKIDEKRTKCEAIKEFDISSYRQKHFNMFSGETMKVLLEFDKKLTEAMFDKFGKSIKMLHAGENRLAINVDVAKSEQFFGFILGLGDSVKILDPQDLRDEFLDYIDKIKSIYKI